MCAANLRPLLLLLRIGERRFPTKLLFPRRVIAAQWAYRRIDMKSCFAAIATAALIGTALPACAEEIGVGVGPLGVTVGQSHRDRDVIREREIVRERRDHRDRDTVVIRRGDRDRDFEHRRRKVIIEQDD
jgi:hypothetical protein